jgi:hypothetical protein
MWRAVESAPFAHVDTHSLGLQINPRLDAFLAQPLFIEQRWDKGNRVKLKPSSASHA